MIKIAELIYRNTTEKERFKMGDLVRNFPKPDCWSQYTYLPKSKELIINLRGEETKIRQFENALFDLAHYLEYGTSKGYMVKFYEL